ncbi:MAG: hypothetical protein Q7S82_02705 [bacterium]|nr:hypothetical protein [bacterium]
MHDTLRGNFRDKKCSDCDEMGCLFQHRGLLVLDDKLGSFCEFCWTERNEAYYRGEEPKPLGVKPPGIPEEFLDRRVKVTTKSGSIYELDLTEMANERIISCDRRKLHPTRVKVICLRIGKSLFLKPRDGSNFDLWWTSPVVSIEVIKRD